MTRGTKCGHEGVDHVRRVPLPPEPQQGQDQQRCGDEQDQVPGSADDPGRSGEPDRGRRGHRVTLGGLLAHLLAPGRSQSGEGRRVLRASRRPDVARTSIGGGGRACEEAGAVQRPGRIARRPVSGCGDGRNRIRDGARSASPSTGCGGVPGCRATRRLGGLIDCGTGTRVG